MPVPTEWVTHPMRDAVGRTESKAKPGAMSRTGVRDLPQVVSLIRTSVASFLPGAASFMSDPMQHRSTHCGLLACRQGPAPRFAVEQATSN